LIEWHPLPFSQGGSIADWQASGQGLAAVRDVSVAEVAFGSFATGSAETACPPMSALHQY